MSTRADPFAALGDQNRRDIIMQLAGGERSVREIADDMAISRPAVSRHLRLLGEAGLVTARAEGAKRIYRLDDTGAARVRSFMEQVWGEATARFRIAVESTRQP